MAERANKVNRGLDALVGIPLACLSSLFRTRRPRPSSPPRVIGLICLGAIGDLLLLSTLTRALRSRLDAGGNERTRLCLLTTVANAGAVPLIPGIDDHAAFPVRQVPGILRFLRRSHFDVLIDATQWARIGALLCSFSGAGCTIGFDTPGQHRAAGYDIRVPHRNDRHETRNFLALGQALFPDLTGEPGLLLPSAPPPDVIAAGLAGHSGPDHVYLHMWPSGGSPRLKEWPAEHWAELAGELLQRGCRLCLTGSGPDAPRNTAFLHTYFSGEERVISLAGKTSLPALAWLLARARGVVSVNTGIMHLAALCGVPTVGLHGATNPLRWGPVGASTLGLLPRQGDFAYLNLGFEYPKGVASSLPYLPVEDVLAGMARLCIL